MSDSSRDTTQKMIETPQRFLSSSPRRDRDSRMEQKPVAQSVPMKPGFYLVATPIGNLRDITFRALDVLSSVDLIICEDTRVTGKLMNAYGFKKKMQVYNDHSTDQQRERLIDLSLIHI